LIVCYFSDIFYLGVQYYIPRGVGIIMKYELVELVVHCGVIVWLCV